MMMGSTFEGAALTNNNGTELLCNGDGNEALKHFHVALQSFALLQQRSSDEGGNNNHDAIMIPSEAHLGAQIDINSVPVGGSVDEPTRCYYSRAFSISAPIGSRLWCTTSPHDIVVVQTDRRTDVMEHNDAVCCSIVCLFNLALTFQEKGRGAEPTMVLTRALRLYELAFELLVGCIGTNDILYMLYMAIVVNKIHVLYDLGRVDESQQEMMSLLDVMTSTDVRPPAFDDILVNQLMFRIFLGPLTTHASAA